jgi:hypothetical protein
MGAKPSDVWNSRDHSVPVSRWSIGRHEGSEARKSGGLRQLHVFRSGRSESAPHSVHSVHGVFRLDGCLIGQDLIAAADWLKIRM